jgi:putative aldouronate transport system substrate-binding protein
MTMNRVKKVLWCAVLIAVSAPLVLASGLPETNSESSININPPGTLPIVNEMVTVDVMTRYSADEHDGAYGEAAFTQWFEDLTNVRINFVDIVEAQLWTERLTLVLAADDLPHTIMVEGVMSGQEILTLGRQGTLIALDDLIDTWMPAYASRLAAHPEYASQLVMPNGSQYSIGTLDSACYHCTMAHKMWVYRPWLETLWLDVPQTTEQFFRMLVRFRYNDPNRTGRADTVPMTGAATGAWNAEPLVAFLMSSFVYTDPSNYLKRDGGQVTFVANTDEWREGLRYMRRLYRDGLMQPEWFTQDAARLRSTVDRPGPAVVGAIPAGAYDAFTTIGGASGRFAEYYPIAPLAGPGGIRQSVYTPYAVAHHTVITRDAPYPEVIARMNDWFYESFVNRAAGRHWAWPEIDYRFLTEEERASGQLRARDFSVADTVALTPAAAGEGTRRQGWFRMAPGWQVGGGTAIPTDWARGPAGAELRLAQATRDLYEPYRADHYIPPNLIVSADLQDELRGLRTLLIGVPGSPGLVQRYYADFVTGRRDIDSDAHWRQYLDELRRAGVDRYVEIMQEAVTAVGY